MDFARRQRQSRIDYCSVRLHTDFLDYYHKLIVLAIDSANLIEKMGIARIGSSSLEVVVPGR